MQGFCYARASSETCGIGAGPRGPACWIIVEVADLCDDGHAGLRKEVPWLCEPCREGACGAALVPKLDRLCNAKGEEGRCRQRTCGYRAAAFFSVLRCGAVLCTIVLHAKTACVRCMPVGHGITDGESTWWPTVSAMRAGALPGASQIPLGVLKNWLALPAPADFSANLRARFHFNRGRCRLLRCGAAHLPGLTLLCRLVLPGLGCAFAPGVCVRLRCTTFIVVVVVPLAAASFAVRALTFALPARVFVKEIGPVRAGCIAPVLLPGVWPE